MGEENGRTRQSANRTTHQACQTKNEQNAAFAHPLRLGIHRPAIHHFVVLTIVPLFVALPILFTDKAQFNDPKDKPGRVEELYCSVYPAQCPG